MPFRPSGYVGWCSTGATNVAEPLDSKKASGWSIGEKPASSYFNWLLQKQDAWIQYLQWRTDLSTVASEEFALTFYGNPGVVGATPIPGWMIVGDWVRSTGSENMIGGAIKLQAVGVAGNVLYVNPEQMRSRDFRMEIVTREMARSASGSYEVGFFTTEGYSSAFPQLGFMRSGASGALAFMWVPTGAASPTHLQLGINPGIGVTAVHRYAVEMHFPTAMIEYDGVQTGIYVGCFGTSGRRQSFGVRTTTGDAANTHDVDKIELGVKRLP